MKVLVSNFGIQECRSLINLRDELRRALGWILPHHPKDEIHKFLRNPFSADYPAGFGDETPRELVSRSVPSHDGLRAHDDLSLFPSGLKPSRQNPEEPIEDSGLAVSTWKASALMLQTRARIVAELH